MSDKLIDTSRLEAALDAFAAARDWERFHTPRNLLLALTGEVGELAEIFQWLSDAEAAAIVNDPARYQHVQEEIADVLLYLMRFAQSLNVDVNAAVAAKLVKNAQKYPPPQG